MRIRNRRTSFAFSSPVPDSVSRSSHLRSQEGLHFDDPFWSENANRCIGGSVYPLRERSRRCLKRQQLLESTSTSLQHANANDTKSLNCTEQRNNRENFVLQMPNDASHKKLELTGRRGRKNVFSGDRAKREFWSNFSVNVVLALPATCPQPEFAEDLQSESELPWKKRRNGLPKIAKQKGRKKGKRAMRSKINRKLLLRKECLKEHDGSQSSESISCESNSESCIHSQINGDQGGQTDVEEKVVEDETVKDEKKQKPRRGRPKRKFGSM